MCIRDSGGAALSIRQITGKPIKFLGVGEKTAALEPFFPDRVASRILGMGDVLGLVEEMEHKVDKEKALKLAQKVQKGKGFTLEDFREQMEQMLSLIHILVLSPVSEPEKKAEPPISRTRAMHNTPM